MSNYEVMVSTDLIDVDVTDVSITNSCLGTDYVLVNAGVVLLDKYVKYIYRYLQESHVDLVRAASFVIHGAREALGGRTSVVS